MESGGVGTGRFVHGSTIRKKLLLSRSLIASLTSPLVHEGAHEDPALTLDEREGLILLKAWVLIEAGDRENATGSSLHFGSSSTSRASISITSPLCISISSRPPPSLMTTGPRTSLT